LVDQSRSMLDSVIHAAVMAACLWSLPRVTTRLVAFAEDVVDLSDDVLDPVELLMRVQLGGGTNVQRAVAYAQDLVQHPRRATVVLISDLFEGGPVGMLERRVSELLAQGTQVLVLAALGSDAYPRFDHARGRRLANLGAEVGAMTPRELATWLAERIS
jgi:hypothetical protein